MRAWEEKARQAQKRKQGKRGTEKGGGGGGGGGGERIYTTACDVYSFAVVSHELLTGRAPFAQYKTMELFQVIMDCRWL